MIVNRTAFQLAVVAELDTYLQALLGGDAALRKNFQTKMQFIADGK